MPQVCLCGNRRPFGPQRGRNTPEETSPPSARKTSSTVTKRFPIIVFPIFPERNIIGGRSDLNVRWGMSGVSSAGIAVFLLVVCCLWLRFEFVFLRVMFTVVRFLIVVECCVFMVYA